MTRLLSSSPRLSKAIATALLAAMLPTATACFGSFQLTRKLYAFNRDVSSNRWIRWVVFIGMAWLPVYASGMVLDAAFGNAVEFWGGRNPFAMAPGTTHEFAGANGETLRTTVVDARRIDMHLVDARGDTHTLALLREDAGVTAIDENGRVFARVSDVAGQTVFEQGPR